MFIKREKRRRDRRIEEWKKKEWRNKLDSLGLCILVSCFILFISLVVLFLCGGFSVPHLLIVVFIASVILVLIEFLLGPIFNSMETTEKGEKKEIRGISSVIIAVFLWMFSLLYIIIRGIVLDDWWL